MSDEDIKTLGRWKSDSYTIHWPKRCKAVKISFPGDPQPPFLLHCPSIQVGPRRRSLGRQVRVFQPRLSFFGRRERRDRLRSARHAKAQTEEWITHKQPDSFRNWSETNSQDSPTVVDNSQYEPRRKYNLTVLSRPSHRLARSRWWEASSSEED